MNYLNEIHLLMKLCVIVILEKSRDLKIPLYCLLHIVGDVHFHREILICNWFHELLHVPLGKKDFLL